MIWVKIDQYDYEVSDRGRVRRIFGRVLKLRTDKDGYKIAVLYKNGKRKDAKIHQLVCAAFNARRPNPGAEVRHRDGRKSNNVPANVVWGNQKQNAEDRDAHGRTQRGEKHCRARFTNHAVAKMRALYQAEKSRARRVGKKYVTRGFIQDLAIEQGINRTEMHRVLTGGSYDLG